jgi:hypothetical protein
MITQKTTQQGGQLVNKAHVDELVNNYKKQRWIHNSNRLGKQDSLSAWFNLEALSGFLQMARDEHADGIKMYFGVYPENFEKTPEFSGRQTIVLVATKEKTNEEGRTINKEIYIQKDNKPEILAFNMSSICPPNCSPGLPFPWEIDISNIGVSIIENNGRVVVI